MTDGTNKTPTVEPKPITTPEPGNAKTVEPAKAPIATAAVPIVEPGKAA